jgi:hypothetical protein
MGARRQEALRSYWWGGKPLPLYPEAGLAGKPAALVTYARFCRRAQQIADELYRRNELGSIRDAVLGEVRRDDAIARKDPFAYLPGLQQRMYRRADETLLAELRAKGLEGADLRLAFLAEWQRREDACVDAHEARHVIDASVPGINHEMTAALSRVIFGGDPPAGLDRVRPLLPQFDLLSTEQIRKVFLSLDPMAER